MIVQYSHWPTFNPFSLAAFVFVSIQNRKYTERCCHHIKKKTLNMRSRIILMLLQIWLLSNGLYCAKLKKFTKYGAPATGCGPGHLAPVP
jgi:hypothetical protein